MAENELKRCPFCGGREIEIVPVPDYAWEVHCNSCGTILGWYKNYARYEAIAAWNRRNGNDDNDSRRAD